MEKSQKKKIFFGDLILGADFPFKKVKNTIKSGTELSFKKS